MQKIRCLVPLVVVCVLIVSFREGKAQKPVDAPFFFVVIADTQFGFWDPEVFPQETANAEFAVATINRLKPAFVVVCGDLINRHMNAAETAEYKRVFAKLDRSVKLHNVAGNHDVNDAPGPTPETINYYRKHFGPNFYDFQYGSLSAVVLDSTLLGLPSLAPDFARQQREFILEALGNARSRNARHLVVFQHHPWFMWQEEEGDHYFNMPRMVRAEYLPLFAKYGVSCVFSGHYHQNAYTKYKGIQLITTGALSRANGDSRHGIRVVVVRDSGIEHQFYDFGALPREVDLNAPLRPPKFQGW